MNTLNKLTKNIRDNIAEYYTLLVIVLAVPAAASLVIGYELALILSFVLQALIGVLYIKGSNK